MRPVCICRMFFFFIKVTLIFMNMSFLFLLNLVSALFMGIIILVYFTLYALLISKLKLYNIIFISNLIFSLRCIFIYFFNLINKNIIIVRVATPLATMTLCVCVCVLASYWLKLCSAPNLIFLSYPTHTHFSFHFSIFF